MSLELTILGCNSAVPAYGRYPTAQVLKSDQHLFLIDCGEGTQFQLSRYKVKRGKIDHIFISHMHGDHYFGLIGLLSTYHLNGRTDLLHIYGPPELEGIILAHLKAANSKLSYEIYFHHLGFNQMNIIFEDENIKVSSFPVNHRIPCCGFKFEEKLKPRKIDSEKCSIIQLTEDIATQLRNGDDFIKEDGSIISNEHLTIPNEKEASSYAYTSDTKYDEQIAVFVKDIKLLYHDSTFGAPFQEKASFTFHSTCIDAAKIAKLANVKQLMLGHFSAKYADPSFLAEEAKCIFENVIVATEGVTTSI